MKLKASQTSGDGNDTIYTHVSKDRMLPRTVVK